MSNGSSSGSTVYSFFNDRALLYGLKAFGAGSMAGIAVAQLSHGNYLPATVSAALALGCGIGACSDFRSIRNKLQPEIDDVSVTDEM